MFKSLTTTQQQKKHTTVFLIKKSQNKIDLNQGKKIPKKMIRDKVKLRIGRTTKDEKNFERTKILGKRGKIKCKVLNEKKILPFALDDENKGKNKWNSKNKNFPLKNFLTKKLLDIFRNLKSRTFYKKSQGRVNFKKKIFLIFFLIISINSEIKILDSNPHLTFKYDLKPLDLYTDVNKIFWKFSKKIPTENKSYLTYQIARLNTKEGRNFLEKVDFPSLFVTHIDIDFFILSFEFIEEDSNKFVFHIQETKTGPQKLGFGIFNSKENKLEPTFLKTISDYPCSIEVNWKTFAYSKASNYFIFSQKVDSFTQKITAGNILDESTWRADQSTRMNVYALQYFLIDPTKAHNTQFAVYDTHNNENVLTFYDYTQNPMEKTKTKTKTEIFNVDSEDRLLIWESTPFENSNYFAYVHYSISSFFTRFTDVNLKSPENPRTVQFRNHDDYYYTHYFFGIKSTNFFMLSLTDINSSGQLAHLFYLFDNHNGENDIEIVQMKNEIFESISNWFNGFYQIYHLTEYGEVLILGYKRDQDGNPSFEIMSKQILEIICHPTCGGSGCLQSQEGHACHGCSDPTNMKATEVGSNTPSTYACDCTTSHPYFDLSSKTCVSTCSKNEVILPAESIRYCLTDNECKERNLYPIETSEGKKTCGSWRECARTTGMYFSVIDDSCMKDGNQNDAIFYDFAFRSRLETDSVMKEIVKATKINDNYWVKCMLEDPFSYSPENICFDEQTCKAKSTDSAQYLIFQNLEGSLCVRDRECFQREGKHLFSSTSCLFSGCPENENILSYDGTICYSKENCLSQGMYLFKTNSTTFICLTKQECIEDLNYLFNVEDNLCQNKETCKLLEVKKGFASRIVLLLSHTT